MNTILYAEDDPNDAALMRIALHSRSDLHLEFAGDGATAIDYLAGRGEFGNRGRHPMPSLIFLDIKMPRVSGFGVLVWIRRHARVRDIPVVMLSSSPLRADVEKAEKLGANTYITKSCSFCEFQSDVITAVDCFLGTAETGPDERSRRSQQYAEGY
jgi:two-component system response regulator